MALIIDGVTIPQTLGSLIVDDQEVYEAYCNGELIWCVPETREPFWMKLSQNGTIGFTIGGSGSEFPSKIIQYSYDGTNWTTETIANIYANGISASANQKVFFSSPDTALFKTNSLSVRLTASSNFSIGGNVCSLFNNTTSLPNYALSNFFSNNTKLTDASNLYLFGISEYCYSRMFYGCTNLAGAPHLPALSLAEGCYDEMFYGCSTLTTPPRLPATTLADNCYQSMFNGCVHLSSVPKLPAKVMKTGCYYYMFSGCTSLVQAPELPATTLETSCYGHMFEGCTSLKSVPALPAKTLKQSCYVNMFKECTALVCLPRLPATTLAGSCYSEMFMSCASLSVGLSSSTRKNEYRIPTTGTGTEGTVSLYNMFKYVPGGVPDTPSINTTYYTNATVV